MINTKILKNLFVFCFLKYPLAIFLSLSLTQTHTRTHIYTHTHTHTHRHTIFNIQSLFSFYSHYCYMYVFFHNTGGPRHSRTFYQRIRLLTLGKWSKMKNFPVKNGFFIYEFKIRGSKWWKVSTANYEGNLYNVCNVLWYSYKYLKI